MLIVELLQHNYGITMVHLKNLELGVEDCSHNRTYHNERFKQTAEAHGLIAEKIGNSGYANTSLTRKTRDLIEKFEFGNFNIYRELYGGAKKESQAIFCKVYMPFVQNYY